jgi:hypothetical protein
MQSPEPGAGAGAPDVKHSDLIPPLFPSFASFLVLQIPPHFKAGRSTFRAPTLVCFGHYLAAFPAAIFFRFPDLISLAQIPPATLCSPRQE